MADIHGDSLFFQGKVLVSEPLSSDVYFHRSVVLVTGHESDGAFGVILNKPVENRVNEVLIDFPEFDAPIYLGGPVRHENIFFIHTLPNITDSLEIIPGLFWGGQFDQIKDLVAGGKISQTQLRFYLGYAGWSKNQLEEEILSESWVVSSLPISTMMTPDTTKLWKACVLNLGKPYSEWIKYPNDPRLN